MLASIPIQRLEINTNKSLLSLYLHQHSLLSVHVFRHSLTNYVDNIYDFGDSEHFQKLLRILQAAIWFIISNDDDV